MNDIALQDAAQTEGSYGYNLPEVIEAARHSLDFLAGIADPDTCTALFPPIFQNIWGLLVGSLQEDRNFDKYAIGLPRGHGKTIVLKMLILFIILFTNRRFITVFCAKEDLAQNIIADVCDMLDSQNIQAVFGNWRSAIESDNKELKKFYFRGRHIMLKPVGINSSVRGLNIKNVRPDVMIFDDVQSRDNARSPTLSKELQHHILGTVMKAKAPENCTFVYVGNMYPTMQMEGSGDQFTCILRNLQNNKGWKSWIVGAILADGKALWEDVQPLEQLLAELEQDVSMGAGEIFFAEVLNDPDNAVSEHFDPAKLVPVPYTKQDLPQGRFIMIDPSLGKKASDAQPVAYCSIYDGKVVIDEIKIKQVAAPVLVKDTLSDAMNGMIPLICAETTAYQATLLQWFQEVADQINLEGIFFRPVAPRGRSKNSRILESFKLLFSGDIMLRDAVKAQYISQAVAFNPLKNDNVDDILDNVAYCYDVLREHGYEALLPLETEFRRLDNHEDALPDDTDDGYDYEGGF